MTRKDSLPWRPSQIACLSSIDSRSPEGGANASFRITPPKGRRTQVIPPSEMSTRSMISW
jgi:hypothetical protein